MKKFTMKATNEIALAAPTSVWGYKGVPGKGGKTLNWADNGNKDEKESV